MTGVPTPTTRAELIALLTEACELEHNLACSYLYTAFSLKQEMYESGVTIDQLHKVRFWASQIFFVASQEMLHLAQAWNLLGSIGGTPYCLRPNLPQSSKYYPIDAKIELEPFGERALKRFIAYEAPPPGPYSWADKHPMIAQLVAQAADRSGKGQVTIGQLYQAIEEGFAKIPDLFVGNLANQVDRQTVQFPTLAQVRDVESATAAIEMIRHQGEGFSADHLDCHFGIFIGILEDFQNELSVSGGAFSPVRPVMTNPVVQTLGDYGADATEIADSKAKDVGRLFDGVYLAMLQALAFAFAPAAAPQKGVDLGNAAIELMTSVVRPIANALTKLPSGVGDTTAGPCFGLVRFDAFPADGRLALRLFRDRLLEFASDARALAETLPDASELRTAETELREISARYQ